MMLFFVDDDGDYNGDDVDGDDDDDYNVSHREKNNNKNLAHVYASNLHRTRADCMSSRCVHDYTTGK